MVGHILSHLLKVVNFVSTSTIDERELLHGATVYIIKNLLDYFSSFILHNRDVSSYIQIIILSPFNINRISEQLVSFCIFKC